MPAKLKRYFLEIAKIAGWLLFGFSTFLSIFIAVIIVGNNSEYDCDLVALASMGSFCFYAATTGAIFIFVANRILGRSQKLLVFSFLGAALIQGGIAGNAYYYQEKDSCTDQTAGTDRFDYILPGMTEEEVVRRVGRPSSIQACHWEFIQKDDPRCAMSYVYSSALAPLIPHYPVIWFDKDGRVIDKYKYHSP